MKLDRSTSLVSEHPVLQLFRYLLDCKSEETKCFNKYIQRVMIHLIMSASSVDCKKEFARIFAPLFLPGVQKQMAQNLISSKPTTAY